MVEEAKLVETESGLEPEGQGWFVVNARDAAWWSHRDVFGYGCPFGSRDDSLFPELGITLRVLQPGEPNCRYHAESTQEDFLVLQGECLALIEGEERRLEGMGLRPLPRRYRARLRRRRLRALRDPDGRRQEARRGHRLPRLRAGARARRRRREGVPRPARRLRRPPAAPARAAA